MLGDLNDRVGNEEMLGVIRKYGVLGRNVSGERLLEWFSELELVVGNTFFRKKGINKLTWQRINNVRLVETALMDYVILEKSALGRLVDVHVGVRGWRRGVRPLPIGS